MGKIHAENNSEFNEKIQKLNPTNSKSINYQHQPSTINYQQPTL
jgi:hypothetical protein